MHHGWYAGFLQVPSWGWKCAVPPRQARVTEKDRKVCQLKRSYYYFLIYNIIFNFHNSSQKISLNKCIGKKMESLALLASSSLVVVLMMTGIEEAPNFQDERIPFFPSNFFSHHWFHLTACITFPSTTLLASSDWLARIILRTVHVR